MPPVNCLNPPPNPFWDFVASLEDHPFFAGLPRSPHRHNGPPSPPPRPAATADSSAPDMSEKARGKQPTVEDPPEIDPSTTNADTRKAEQKSKPFQGRGRFASAFDAEAENKAAGTKRGERERPFRGRGRFAHAFEGEDTESHHGRRHPCRAARGRGGCGGPPMMNPFFGGGSPWAVDAQPQPEGQQHSEPPHQHPHGPPHVRGRHAHQRHLSPRGPRPDFNLGEFLNNLGGKLGIDLSNAAEGLGLATDRFSTSRTGQDVDFEPRADIFENNDRYTVHLSLPGAKKSDIGIDYDGEHSVLCITGVVYRPDVDEQMLKELVVDGRKRETGVFEKAIRIGTKHEPASINVAGISAKMTDGVLVVKIPKVEKVHQKREVPITADPVVEGQANYEDEYSEKPVLFDAEEQESGVINENVATSERDEISLIDMKDNEPRNEPKEDPTPAEVEPQVQPSEVAQGRQQVKASSHEESLPAYAADDNHDEEDWEKFSDASGEGEYMKINVD